MKSYIHLWYYPDKFLLSREKFQINGEKIRKYISCQKHVCRHSYWSRDYYEKYNRTGQYKVIIIYICMYRFIVLSGNNLVVQGIVFAPRLCADLASYLLSCDLLMHKKMEIKRKIIFNICWLHVGIWTMVCP